MIQPFRITIEEEVLNDLQRRLTMFRATRSPEAFGWEDGADLGYLSDLIDHWTHRYNWRSAERCLNKHHHYTTQLQGQSLHFIHEPGRGPKPLPLILIHGWPDGFQRFHKLIPLLTDPAAHGGDAEDAFDAVVPSLPGCGFSTRGPDGPALGDFGGLLHRLMHDVLGYKRYGAHGGDVGATVCGQFRLDHEIALAGVHLTNVPPSGQTSFDDFSGAEKEYLARREAFQRLGGGYMRVQGTKPWTLAVALNDSPAGLAAWIVEKMQAWSDCEGDVERRFSKNDIITNVMLYWVTQSIGTSFLGYRDLLKRGNGATPRNKRGSPSRGAPAGFAIFPHDIVNAPREWAERFYDVRHWSEMPSGGHFAAWEEPELLAADIRTFFRDLREDPSDATHSPGPRLGRQERSE